MYNASERVFAFILNGYERTLATALRHPLVMLLVTIGTIGLTAYLFFVVPKGFFPQQDTGRLVGQITADQDTSFQTMEHLLTQYATIVSKDPAIDNVIAFTGGGGGGGTNSARMFAALKPLKERGIARGPGNRQASQGGGAGAGRGVIFSVGAGPSPGRTPEPRRSTSTAFREMTSKNYSSGR